MIIEKLSEIKDRLSQILSRIPESEELPEQGQIEDTIDKIESIDEKSSNSADSKLEDTGERDHLITTLSELDSEVNKIPGKSEIEKHTEYSVHNYVSEFGDLDTALKAAGINKKERLLNVIEELAEDLERTPNTVDIDEHTPYWGSVYATTFGSWDEALEQADIDIPEQTSQSTTGPPQATESNEEPTTNQSFTDLGRAVDQNDGADIMESYSDIGEDPDESSPSRETLLEELHRLNESVEGILKGTHIQSESDFIIRNYTEEFGSLDDALEAAGIDRRKQMLSELESTWRDLGEQPSKSQMNTHGAISSTMIMDYFDTWEDACEAANPNPATHLAGVQELTTYDNITDDGRLDGSFVGKVTWRIDSPDRRRDAKLRIKGLKTDRVWIDVWRKHKIGSDFPEGRWYRFDGLRVNVWEEDGDIEKRLHSTSDLEVEILGSDIERGTLCSEASQRGLIQLRGSNVIPETAAGDETEEGHTSQADTGSATDDLEDSSTEDPIPEDTEPNRGRKGFSKEEILEEIQAVALEVGWSPTASEMEEHGDVSLTTIRNHFESWPEARKAAGVDQMSQDRLEELRNSQDAVPREVLLDEIRALHNSMGDSITPADVVSFTDYEREDYEAAFGSVINAMREADVDI